MRTRQLLAALAAVFVLGCDSASRDVTAPNASLDQAGNGTAPEAFVTGSAHFWDPGRQAWITSVLQARELPDGSVHGRFEIRAHLGPAGGAKLNGRITCMVIQGNTAWLGGIVEKAVDPANIGMAYGFKAIDNGEGVGATPDQIGRRWSPPSPESYCAEMPDAQSQPVRDVEAGNLVVHGN